MMLAMLLAQADLGQLPAAFLKEMILFTVGSLVALALIFAGIFTGLQYFADRRRERREEVRAASPPAPSEISPLPLPVQKIFPNATMKDLAEKHDEHSRRLDGHDQEIQNLWMTMRKEDKEVRQEFTNKFDALRKEIGDWTATMSRALGRLEGEDKN